jgi:hypothetical protein
MADINLSPYTAEQQAMDRRRKMAEALQQQAIAPIEMPNVPGARVSPYQGLAKLLQGYIAGKNLERADQEQKAYETSSQEDVARLLRNMGKTETVPGDIISPAVPADITPAGTDIEENNARKNLIAYNLQNSVDGMRKLPPVLSPYKEGETTFMPSSITDRIIKETEDLPFKTTQDVINKPAVAEVRGPSRQVPYLSADLLDPNNPNAMKTGTGRMMLAQVLMQQRAQEQAAALRKQEAEQAIQSVAPGATLFQGGKPIYTNPKDSPLREIKTNDPVTGMPVTKYYPENVLVAMGGIPDQFKGFAADLIMAKGLPAQVLNDPQLLNLVGSQLNKQAGQVTQEDVANYMLKVAETRAKLGYEGIPFAEPKPITAARNPLIQSKPLPPQGSQLINGQVYDTPKGRGRWNGTSFTTVD